MGSTVVLPYKKQQSGKLFRCQVVNFFSVTGGKQIDCHEFHFGKEIRRHGGKLSKCRVVKKFIDIHIWYLLEICLYLRTGAIYFHRCQYFFVIFINFFAKKSGSRKAGNR